jgi:hypothetical protein
MRHFSISENAFYELLFMYICQVCIQNIQIQRIICRNIKYAFVETRLALHRKKRFTSFPSPAGMSLTKLPPGRNNSVMTPLFPPRESLVVTSRLGTGNFRTFFLRCRLILFSKLWRILVQNTGRFLCIHTMDSILYWRHYL